MKNPHDRPRSENESRKRRVVVELFKKLQSGQIVAAGSLVTEYAGNRRGGAVRAAARSR